MIATKLDKVSPAWNPWLTNGYINKYYRSGNNFCIRGKVSFNPTVEEIVDYCGFAN